MIIIRVRPGSSSNSSAPFLYCRELARILFGRVNAICSSGDDEIGKQAEDTIQIPSLDEDLDPLLLSVPLQLIAYHISVLKGTDVDQPRNLAKSVTVE